MPDLLPSRSSSTSAASFFSVSPRPLLTAGVDEAGRGCLAGPVAAGAVILPAGFHAEGLTDSKKVSEPRRRALEQVIKREALAWAVGVVWPEEIDRINILQASLKAMRLALARLRTGPELVLVDGNQRIPVLALPQETIVDGDALEQAISAASILAKVFRDRLMTSLDKRYPGYGFARHKGYGSAAHRAALAALGPCRMHRRSFRGVLPEREAKQGRLWMP